MKDILEEIIKNDNVVTLIGFCVTALIAYITARKTLSNNIKSINVEHFKNKGIEVQQRVLDTWSGILFFDMETSLNKYVKEKGCDNLYIYTADEKKEKNSQKENLEKNQKKETEIIRNLLQESYIYSSKSTIKAISTYQQYSYKGQASNKKTLKIFKSINTIKVLVFIPRIIKRMKYDFTGEKVDSLELIKMKINDWNLKKELIARFFIIWYFIKENLFIISLIIIMLSIVLIIYFVFL